MQTCDVVIVGAGAAGRVLALAPADDAFVGLDLQETPARWHQERGQSGDLHGGEREGVRKWRLRWRAAAREPLLRPARRCGPCRRRRPRRLQKM